MLNRVHVLAGLVAIGLTLAMLGANCAGPVTTPKTDNGPATLRAFSSENEFRSFLASQATALNRNGGGPGTGGFATADQANSSPSAPTVAAADESGDSGGQGYSTTNIQEVGVDESDIVKNNGSTIYRLTNRADQSRIQVVKAAPPGELAVLSTIGVDDYGSEMYLAGNRLVALSGYGYYGYGYYGGGGVMPMAMGATGAAEAAVSSSSGSGSAGSPDAAVVDPSTPNDTTPATAVSPAVMPPIGGDWGDGSQTTVTLFDVTDPANPTLTKKIRFEGSLAASRLIGTKLHLVLSTVPRVAGSTDGIEAMTTDQWLPQYQVVSSDGTTTASGTAVNWQNCLRPSDPNGYAMTVVVTLDIEDPDAAFETTAVTANVGTIYASTQALYLTDTQYSYDDFSARTDTVVHKLRFTDAGTDYVATGTVPGRPLNQYSLGEYKDNLRIATTLEQYGMDTSTMASGVYVLGENGANLDVLGKIEDIARGEQIYSARFMGERGFLVTFKRVDPLFTLDLSDPANPVILGTLKVPGYSDHIQLLDENHLLTIGRDTQEAGGRTWVQGVLLTIFDITDFANPQILVVNGQEAREVIGGRGTYSEANGNPKAFNYYPDKNALAFPIDMYDGNTLGAEYGSHSFTGLLVYRVTVENGFQKLGQIASAEGQTQDGCFQSYYGSTRGVFIGNDVYSVTDLGVKVASLDDVATLTGQVTFQDAEPPMANCYWATEVPDMALPPSSDLN